MLGDIEVDDTPAVMGEHDEDEEDTQAGWLRTIACPGVEEPNQHLYRTVEGFLPAGPADLERELFSCSSGIAICSPTPWTWCSSTRPACSSGGRRRARCGGAATRATGAPISRKW
jgi:hypothetical protein